MPQPDLDTSVSDWVIDYPCTHKIFERLGLDYCCGGRSLGYVCVQHDLDPQQVLAQLRAAIATDAGRA